MIYDVFDSCFWGYVHSTAAPSLFIVSDGFSETAPFQLYIVEHEKSFPIYD